MALGDMPRAEMAAQLGVDPGTISRWCGDKGAPPKRVYLAQWSLITGVPLEWLEAGESAPTPPPNGPGGSKLARLTAEKQGRAQRASTTHQYLPGVFESPVAA